MKTLRALLLAAVVLAGVAASGAPMLAASHTPPHATAGYVLDDLPTPTPTPGRIQPDPPCEAGGC